MTSLIIVQILVDYHQEFAMKQKRKKDVVVIVSLVCFPPITLFTLFTNYGISESNLANGCFTILFYSMVLIFC